MFCPQCGKRIDGYAAFCPECGASLENRAQTPNGAAIDHGPAAVQLNNRRPVILAIALLACIAIAVFAIANAMPTTSDRQERINSINEELVGTWRGQGGMSVDYSTGTIEVTLQLNSDGTYKLEGEHKYGSALRGDGVWEFNRTIVQLYTQSGSEGRKLEYDIINGEATLYYNNGTGKSGAWFSLTKVS